MRKQRRRLIDTDDNDPTSLLSNLFDTAMVFAVALMVALVVKYSMTEFFSQDNYTIVKNPGEENMEIITKEGQMINKYRPSDNQESGSNKGKRVGSAYQLEDGRIIYLRNSEVR